MAKKKLKSLKIFQHCTIWISNFFWKSISFVKIICLSREIGMNMKYRLLIKVKTLNRFCDVNHSSSLKDIWKSRRNIALKFLDSKLQIYIFLILKSTSMEVYIPMNIPLLSTPWMNKWIYKKNSSNVFHPKKNSEQKEMKQK